MVRYSWGRAKGDEEKEGKSKRGEDEGGEMRRGKRFGPRPCISDTLAEVFYAVKAAARPPHSTQVSFCVEAIINLGIRVPSGRLLRWRGSCRGRLRRCGPCPLIGRWRRGGRGARWGDGRKWRRRGR